jgi:hypothetical protein
MPGQQKSRHSLIGLMRLSGPKPSTTPLFKSGCLYPLAGFLLLYGLYVILLGRLIPDPVVPFVFGVFTAIGTGGLLTGVLGLFRSRQLGVVIRRDMEAAPKQDGRFEAAGGIIQPIGEALISPFQGLPCVAYEYDVTMTGRDNQAAGSDAWGWALTPSVIRTEQGEVRLLGFPDLARFDEAIVGEGARDRIREFFRNTEFETIHKADIKKGLNQLMERSVDDDGLVRADIRRGTDLDPAAVSFEHRQFTERLIPVETEVTAFGIFSASRGGLVSNPGKMSEVVLVWPGKGEELAAVIEKESSGRLSLGILVFLLSHAFLSFAFFILWLKGYYD